MYSRCFDVDLGNLNRTPAFLKLLKAHGCTLDDAAVLLRDHYPTLYGLHQYFSCSNANLLGYPGLLVRHALLFPCVRRCCVVWRLDGVSWDLAVVVVQLNAWNKFITDVKLLAKKRGMFGIASKVSAWPSSQLTWLGWC